MQLGSRVKVLAPFNYSFPEVYEIVGIEDGIYFLEGIEGAFSSIYLELVE